MPDLSGLKSAIRKVLGLTASNTEAVGTLDTQTLTNKTFLSSGLKVRNPADTFSYTIEGGGITADRTLLLPATTGLDILLSVGASSNVTGAKIFSNNTLNIKNPSATRNYTFATSEITLARTITLPLLAANDIFVFESHIQTLLNKTIGNFLDFTKISIPADPAAEVGRVYLKEKDADNNGLFVKLQIGGNIVEKEVAFV